jgi:hypothetical protein
MLGGLASAHHAVVGYDRAKTVVLKGVVTEWRWRNPHAFLVFNVKDESGKVVEWTGELLSPISMTAAGLSRSSFKPGDEVTITALPALKGTPQSIIQKIVNGEGKVVLDRSNPLEP